MMRSDDNILQDVEAELRQLVLSVGTLESLKSWKWPPETTFRISLFVRQAEQRSDLLRQSVTNGSWYCPQSGEGLRRSEKRRPVHETRSPGVRLYMQQLLVGGER